MRRAFFINHIYPYEEIRGTGQSRLRRVDGRSIHRARQKKQMDPILQLSDVPEKRSIHLMSLNLEELEPIDNHV